MAGRTLISVALCAVFLCVCTSTAHGLNVLPKVVEQLSAYENVEELGDELTNLVQVMAKTETDRFDPVGMGAVQMIQTLRKRIAETQKSEEAYVSALSAEFARRKELRDAQREDDLRELDAAKKRFAVADHRRKQERSSDKTALDAAKSEFDRRTGERKSELELINQLKAALAPSGNGTAADAFHVAKKLSEQIIEKKASNSTKPKSAKKAGNGTAVGEPKRPSPKCVSMTVEDKKVEGQAVTVPAFVNNCDEARLVEFTFCGEDLSCKLTASAKGFPCWFPTMDTSCKTVKITTDAKLEN
eukprot:GFYU01002554.1.p1 GENE.GFYU01002554.1~~GFYU01002554.1.p1  ORF type:complete len:301 (-),score=100.95 GFYU01002554.1:405-1307(-)